MGGRSFVIIVSLINLYLELTDFSEQSSKPRVCIIGAGYSGLGTARHMKNYGLDFTVFEASRYIGGIWRFDSHIGTEEDGLPLFTSQYKNLRTNIPRQTMEYVGYPFPEGTPSYPTGTCVYKYLQSFVKHFDLMRHIQFQTLVTNVEWVTNRWSVTYRKINTNENVTESCDFVVVANGEFGSPFMPNYKGQNEYKGIIMHSHDYKDAEDFRNKRVLLVGAGASGLDLAIHLVNVTSKLVHSHHLVYRQPNFPDNYVKKPDILSFTPTGAVFKDESIEDFDVVIYCTGYNFVYPYLSQEGSGITATKKYVLPLYQHVVNIKYPTMTFVGVSKKVISKVRDLQGQYSAALAAGKFKLPSQSVMLKSWLEHVSALREKNYNITEVNLIGEDMDDYFHLLQQEANIARPLKLLAAIRNFTLNRLQDLMNYRDYDYKILNDTAYERTYNPRKDLTCLFDQ